MSVATAMDDGDDRDFLARMFANDLALEALTNAVLDGGEKELMESARDLAAYVSHKVLFFTGLGLTRMEAIIAVACQMAAEGNLSVREAMLVITTAVELVRIELEAMGEL